MFVFGRTNVRVAEYNHNVVQNTKNNTENSEKVHENLFTDEYAKNASSNTVTGKITAVEDTAVTYEYIVDGQRYTGEFKVDIKGFKASAVYSVGDHITVEYIPGNPTKVKNII